MDTQSQSDGAVASHPPRSFRIPVRAIIAVGSLILFAWFFVDAGQLFLEQFSSKYAWTEMLINYQGGFVKRGLLGEIVFQLNDIIPGRSLIAVLEVSLYLGTAIWLVHLVASRLSFAGLLFLFSPATILFPVYNFDAFGRKDIIIIVAFAMSSLFVSRVKSANAAFGLIILTYFVIALICETVLFYFPLACMLLALCRPQSIQWELGAAAVAVLFLLLTIRWPRRILHRRLRRRSSDLGRSIPETRNPGHRAGVQERAGSARYAVLTIR